MKLLSRNNPEKHPMLKKILANFNKENNCITTKKWFNFLYLTELPGNYNLLITDDPIAYFFGRLILRKNINHHRFWALEIYEEQVVADSAKKIMRKILFTALSRFAFQSSQSIIFPSKLRMDYANKKHPSANIFQKSSIIINIPDIPKAASTLPNKIEKTLIDLRSRFKTIAIYSGSLQSGRGISKLINEIEKQTEVLLILCGSVKGTALLENSNKWKSTKYLGNFDPSEITAIYKLCDVGVLSYENQPINTRLCAPVKIWEYLDANLKIVGNKNEALLNEWSHFIDEFFDEDLKDFSTAISKAKISQKKKPEMPNFDINKIIQ